MLAMESDLSFATAIEKNWKLGLLLTRILAKQTEKDFWNGQRILQGHLCTTVPRHNGGIMVVASASEMWDLGSNPARLCGFLVAIDIELLLSVGTYVHNLKSTYIWWSVTKLLGVIFWIILTRIGNLSFHYFFRRGEDVRRRWRERHNVATTRATRWVCEKSPKMSPKQFFVKLIT
jgi:hypothetical protein